MPDAPETSENVSIRCPSCRQRFSVDDKLMGRMVECGGCDTRFRITEEHVIRSKKFYPGEREGADLNHFQRVPLPAAAPEGLQTMRYADFHNIDQLGPAPPQRIIAGVVGVGMMLVFALMLIFANSPGAVFSAMPMESRLIIAGFVSVLGLVMLIYANPSARAKAAFFGILLSAGLVSLPFFFKGQTIVTASASDPYKDPVEPLFPSVETDELAQLRQRFTTKPLEAEQARLEKSGTGKKAYGVFLTGMLQRNIYTVRDYLIRDTLADLSSHPYPRDNGDYLMILTGVSMSLDEAAVVAGRLGETREIHPEIGIIVVSVNNEQFLAGAADKLNNKDDPAFYELNQRELASLDMDRVKRAVERLADAPPVIYRTDISRTFTELMEKPGVTFHDLLARALLAWVEEPGPAGKAALKVLRGEIAAGNPVSENLVALIAKEQTPGAVPVLNGLWVSNPALWDSHFAKFGAEIEPGVLEQLDSEDAPLRRSAIKLLGTVGTKASLPELRKLVDAEDPEVRVLAQRTIERIEGR